VWHLPLRALFRSALGPKQYCNANNLKMTFSSRMISSVVISQNIEYSKNSDKNEKRSFWSLKRRILPKITRVHSSIPILQNLYLNFCLLCNTPLPSKILVFKIFGCDIWHENSVSLALYIWIVLQVLLKISFFKLFFSRMFYKII